jgi:hypothetical protein
MPFVVLPLAMPIVVASSSCVWSAIAVIARSPMRERRGPRTMVRRVGSRALEIFLPHPVGSSAVWSAIAVIARSPMRERRGPCTVVRRVGSRALVIFLPRPVGSSTRIGVRPVVIGAPTVRLAEIVGAGCVVLAAAAAITMRLRGRAAASGRPPPAVRA